MKTISLKITLLLLLGAMVPVSAMEQKKALSTFEQKELNNSLLNAVREGNLQKIKDCLENGADVNAKDIYHDTPLLLTCFKGNTELAEMLIKKGADVNAKNTHNQTPLLMASLYRHTNLAKMLIKKGADVNAQDDNNDTALLFASFYGQIELAEILIKNDADVNAQNLSKRTPLIQACFKGYMKLAEILIKNGADVNAQDDNNDTALTHACRRRYTQIAELLINNGANIYSQNNYGDTAFRVASQNNTQEFLEHLQGVQNQVNNFKNNPTKWPVKAPLIPHVPKSICLNLLYLNLLSFSYRDISTCLALLENRGKKNLLLTILKETVFSQKSKKEQKKLRKSGFPVNDKEYTLKRNLLENKNNNRFTNIVFARNN